MYYNVIRAALACPLACASSYLTVTYGYLASTNFEGHFSWSMGELRSRDDGVVISTIFRLQSAIFRMCDRA